MQNQNRFTVNTDGTVTDNETGIIWCQKDSWQIIRDWLTFPEALQFVDSMNKKDFLGHHDWRLPEKEEVEKIYLPSSTIKDRSNMDIHLDPAFEAGGGNGCWCLPFDQRAAFYFSYQSGISQTFDQDFSQGHVRLARL